MKNPFWLVLYMGWIAAVVLSSLTASPPKLDLQLLGWDKAQHVAAYAVMTLLGGMTLARWVPSADRAWLLSAGLAVFIGFLVEAGQGIMGAGRRADWQDLGANLLGAVAALGLGALWRVFRVRR